LKLLIKRSFWQVPQGHFFELNQKRFIIQSAFRSNPLKPSPMNQDTKSLAVSTLNEMRQLVENLLLLLSEKEKTVIVRRFNLDAKGKSTLEEVGTEFSVTRERIRQIEKNALSKMKRNVFNSALKDLHLLVSDTVRSHGGLFRKDTLVENLSKMLVDSEELDFNCLDLALVLHEELECVGNTINFYPYIRERSLAGFSLKHASNQLVNQLHKYGDTKRAEKIHKDLASVFGDIDFDLTKMLSLIDIDKRLTLVDDDLVGLLEWRHIHPRTLRDKILFIMRKDKKPMHFLDISERIKSAGFDNRSVNVQAVHNELIRYESFVLIGRGIYALGEWGYERGTVAEVIEKILAKGAELSQDEIVEKVLERRQVKKITIVLALKNSEKFERTGRKIYKLKV
jgi:hypothetical protein